MCRWYGKRRHSTGRQLPLCVPRSLNQKEKEKHIVNNQLQCVRLQNICRCASFNAPASGCYSSQATAAVTTRAVAGTARGWGRRVRQRGQRGRREGGMGGGWGVGAWWGEEHHQEGAWKTCTSPLLRLPCKSPHRCCIPTIQAGAQDHGSYQRWTSSPSTTSSWVIPISTVVLMVLQYLWTVMTSTSTPAQRN